MLGTLAESGGAFKNPLICGDLWHRNYWATVNFGTIPGVLIRFRLKVIVVVVKANMLFRTTSAPASRTCSNTAMIKREGV
mmetsp:Transcript_9929/g.31709  ORF Transcript_9929/g.31709 Transcript_9929/m.31709 type:complete len:80 (+) Transcript_9929:255-494(+)